jgi:hypothetical protein
MGPVAGQHEGLLLGRQRPVVVDEPDPAVQLRIAGKPLLIAGHADQDQAELAAVVVVAQLLQRGHLQPVRLVHDEQLGERGAAVRPVADALVEGVLGTHGGQLRAQLVQFLVDDAWGDVDGGGVEQGVPLVLVATGGEVPCRRSARAPRVRCDDQ